jgi:hypothetical protein
MRLMAQSPMCEQPASRSIRTWRKSARLSNPAKYHYEHISTSCAKDTFEHELRIGRVNRFYIQTGNLASRQIVLVFGVLSVPIIIAEELDGSVPMHQEMGSRQIGAQKKVSFGNKSATSSLTNRLLHATRLWSY